MRIKKISTSPDRSGKYKITFDDETCMRLYRQTVEDFSLYSGMEISDDMMGNLSTAAGEMSAKMRAVRIVSATNVSKRDLQRRLIRKGENPEQVKSAVDWMEELSLLDDGKTAEMLVQRCISKGYGLARAKQVLYEKQIPKEYWEAVLADYPSQEEKILDFLRNRLTADSDQKEIKRTMDALIRRGHSYYTIKRALHQLSVDFDAYSED